jgi:hypothetical protein
MRLSLRCAQAFCLAKKIAAFGAQSDEKADLEHQSSSLFLRCAAAHPLGGQAACGLRSRGERARPVPLRRVAAIYRYPEEFSYQVAFVSSCIDDLQREMTRAAKFEGSQVCGRGVGGAYAAAFRSLLHRRSGWRHA